MALVRTRTHQTEERVMVAKSLPLPLIKSMWLFAGLSVGQGALAMDGLRFGADAAYTREDNIAHAAQSNEIRSDTIASLSLAGDFSRVIQRHFRLVFRGLLKGEQYASYDGLSNVGAGALVRMEHRSSGRLTAPTFAVFAKAIRTDYNTSLRDNTEYRAGISAQKAITDRVTISGEVFSAASHAKGSVFDVRQSGITLNADFQWGPRLSQYLTYGYLSGDVISTARWSWASGHYAEQSTLDDAFAGADLYAYRVNGDTHVVTLGFNIALNSRQSIDTSARFATTRTDGDLNYDNRIVAVAYLFQFQ